MGEWGDDHLPGRPEVPWDLADQIDEVEREVARQARKYQEMRAAIEQADFLLGPPGAPRPEG